MIKHRKSIQDFKSLAMDANHLQRLKGGGDPAAEIEKLLKKLDDQMKKGDHKKMLKTQDKLDCLGYISDDCCGNGNGSW